jgi:hypothetical protein
MKPYLLTGATFDREDACVERTPSTLPPHRVSRGARLPSPWVCLYLCVFAPSAALAENDTDVKEVRAMLSGFEQVPTVQELLVGRTPDSLADTLETIARSGSTSWFVRARAVALLPDTGARRARASVERIALEVEEPMVLRSALLAAGRLRLRAPLVRRLQHADPHVREVAERALVQEK